VHALRPLRLATLALGVAALVAQPAMADEMIGPKSKPVAVRPAAGTVAAARAPRPAAMARPKDTSNQVWLFDYIERLLSPDATKTVQRRPRILTARLPKAAPLQTALLDEREAAPAASPLKTTPIAAIPAIAPVPAPPAASPIVTGALPVPTKPNMPMALQGDDLVMTAERAQAAQDLVKLELALRTYDELRQSGQAVFETRPDWRVLERANDALSGAEQAAALAVGFEANAYINEAQKTIVIGIAGSKDLRRHLIAADIWQALVKAEQPQHFFMAKSYARSVIARYQLQGFQTECVGHSLGGGACAYLAGELGIRALVINPITAGKPAATARFLVTNYVVDGDIANLVYGARGNAFGGEIQWISDGRGAARAKVIEKYGALSGPILVIKELRNSVDSHKVSRALDHIAAHAGVERVK
jgi:hypothetical protein